MNTYYCVLSTFDDRGRVTAAIVDRTEAETQPESSFTSTSMKDIYTDWYDSYEDAVAVVEAAKNA